MPRIATIDDVYRANHDEQIMIIRGRLKSLWDRSEGTHPEFGDWTLQNGELTDGRDTVKVVFKDRDKLATSIKGREIEIACSESKQGWKGVKAKDEYNKKTNKDERVLWVTSAADISIIDDNGRREEPTDDRGRGNDRRNERSEDRRGSDTRSRSEDRGSDRSSSRREEPTDDRGGRQQDRPEPSRPGSPEAILQVKANVMRSAHLYNICVDCVFNLVAPNYKKTTGEDIDADHFQAAVSTLYITHDRESFNDKVSLAKMLPFKMPEAEPPREGRQERREESREPARNERREQPRNDPPPPADEPPPIDEDDIPF